MSREHCDIAESAINHCKAIGGWVILQNLHMVPLWLPKLQLMLQVPQTQPSSSKPGDTLSSKREIKKALAQEQRLKLIEAFLQNEEELNGALRGLNKHSNRIKMKNCIANILFKSTVMNSSEDGGGLVLVSKCTYVWKKLVGQLVSFTLGFKMFLSMEMVAMAPSVDKQLLHTGIFKNSYQVSKKTSSVTIAPPGLSIFLYITIPAPLVLSLEF